MAFGYNHFISNIESAFSRFKSKSELGFVIDIDQRQHDDKSIISFSLIDKSVHIDYELELDVSLHLRKGADYMLVEPTFFCQVDHVDNGPISRHEYSKGTFLVKSRRMTKHDFDVIVESAYHVLEKCWHNFCSNRTATINGENVADALKQYSIC